MVRLSIFNVSEETHTFQFVVLIGNNRNDTELIYPIAWTFYWLFSQHTIWFCTVGNAGMWLITNNVVQVFQLYSDSVTMSRMLNSGTLDKSLINTNCFPYSEQITCSRWPVSINHSFWNHCRSVELQHTHSSDSKTHTHNINHQPNLLF